MRCGEDMLGVGIGKDLKPGCCSSIRMPMDSIPPIDPRHQGEDQVHRADVLVIGRENPSPPAMREPIMSGFQMGATMAMAVCLCLLGSYN